MILCKNKQMNLGGVLMNFNEWNDFNKDGNWTAEIDVRNFIQLNYKPYTGDSSFLTPITDKTQKLWNKVLSLYAEERKNGGVLDIDTHTPSGVNAFNGG